MSAGITFLFSSPFLILHLSCHSFVLYPHPRENFLGLKKLLITDVFRPEPSLALSNPRFSPFVNINLALKINTRSLIVFPCWQTLRRTVNSLETFFSRQRGFQKNASVGEILLTTRWDISLHQGQESLGKHGQMALMSIAKN